MKYKIKILLDKNSRIEFLQFFYWSCSMKIKIKVKRKAIYIYYNKSQEDIMNSIISKYRITGTYYCKKRVFYKKCKI